MTGVTHASRRPMGLAVGCVATTIAGTMLAVRNGQSPIGDSFLLDLIIVGTVYAVVGGFLASRVPRNRIGWLLIAAAWLWSLDMVASQYAVYGAITVPGSLPAVGFATWLAAWLWVPGNVLLFFGLPILFPDGHLPSRRWRPVAALGLVVIAVAATGQALAAWPVRDEVTTLLPGYDASSMPGAAGTLTSIGTVGQVLVLPFLGILSLIARYRAVGSAERQQLRWFAVTTGAGVTLVSIDQFLGQVVPGIVGVLSAIGLALIPIGIGVAILRYRLYDLDRIISRTLGWAAVTVLLAAVFVAAVVVLEAALSGATQGQTLAVAASTIAAAALFQPVRVRVQRTVDRRFDRTRYDAEQTAVAFADRLRNETDMEKVATDLTATTRRVLAPATLDIWLRGTGR